MSENESVTLRLRELRERAGLSMDDLAKGMGYSRASSIQRYVNPDEYRKQYFAPDLAAKLAKALVGKGSPPIQAKEIWDLTRPTGSLISSYDPDEVETQTEGGGAVYSREHWRPAINGALPEIDAKLGAGSGTVGDIITLPVGTGSVSGHRVIAEWLIPEDYLRNEAKASPISTIISEIVGDSMWPTYSPGDRVIIDLAQDRMVADTVYSISDGYSEPQIKRLQRIPFSDPPQVRIISDNPALETFTADLDKLTIIGRVCGHIARK